jgi:serine/threonine protein kinase
MLTGEPPIQALKLDKLCAAIVAGHWTFPKRLHPSDVGRDFFRRLLTVDPTARLTAAQALDHPWIRTGPPTHATDWAADRRIPRPNLRELASPPRTVPPRRRGEEKAPGVGYETKRPRKKVVISRKELEMESESMVQILLSHPSVTYVDLSTEDWSPKSARKVFGVLQGSPSVRRVVTPGGRVLRATELTEAELLEPQPQSGQSFSPPFCAASDDDCALTEGLTTLCAG